MHRTGDLARRLVDSAVGVFAGTAGQALESDRLPPDDHRPWPAPPQPWVMAQRWEHLLFAHWPVPPEALRALVPGGLDLDVLDGSAWIGVTPFRVRRLRVRGLPAVPGLSDFNEINVRTYVTAEDKPGVFFFSLDADTVLGVQAARLWYALPYYLASMRTDDDSGWFGIDTERNDPSSSPVRFTAVYRPAGPVRPTEPGSLEWWLTERYCLYASSQGELERAEIHHAPWPLQRAEAWIRVNTMAAPLGLQLGTAPAFAHYAEALDVSVWRPEPLQQGRGRASRRGRKAG